MSKRREYPNRTLQSGRPSSRQPIKPKIVESLLPQMREGQECQSILDLAVENDAQLMQDLRTSLNEIEQIRGRPCIVYVANVIRGGEGTAISSSDHLPFAEMVDSVPQESNEVDIFLVTPGGVGEQVSLFVDALRRRFESVEFILPYKAMSAGTLWAISGERIWMDRRACLGPIDPQVPSKDGMLVPAQSLLSLLNALQQEGDKALKQQGRVPWSYVRLIDMMDQKQLGHALTATDYVVATAAKYLNDYKFRLWTERSETKEPVTPEVRLQRAHEVARKMVSHEHWKAHGHAINRDAVYNELQIKIENIEEVDGLERAVRRLWALFYYVFDKGPAAKCMLSQNYSYVRNVTQLNIQIPQQGGQSA